MSEAPGPVFGAGRFSLVEAFYLRRRLPSSLTRSHIFRPLSICLEVLRPQQLSRWITPAVLVLLAVGLIGAAVSYHAASDARDAARAAEDFLASLAGDSYSVTYAGATTTGFRLRFGEGNFHQYAQLTGLTRFYKAEWLQRQIDDQYAELVGTVFTDDFGEVPVRVEMLKYEDGWRVLNIRARRVRTPRRAPSEGELRRLMTQSLLAFNNSAARSDFSVFHQAIDERWQPHVTPDDLLGAFEQFAGGAIDISGIEYRRPVFDPAPEIDEQGVMRVRGHYDTEPSEVRFDFRFGYSVAGWRLVGMTLDVGEPEESGESPLIRIPFAE